MGCRPSQHQRFEVWLATLTPLFASLRTRSARTNPPGLSLVEVAPLLPFRYSLRSGTGTGTGMILFNLGKAAGLESYAGLEPSRSAASFVADWVKSDPALAGRVEVHVGTATDAGQLDRPRPDLVVLNSVVQLFPSPIQVPDRGHRRPRSNLALPPSFFLPRRTSFDRGMSLRGSPCSGSYRDAWRRARVRFGYYV
ncbi:hypothetical protein GGTG_13928 [Gaeumannomyces tritici R3-111a-1]|uniref:Uncharacterized protein n=1 Tax=Gaeumannomyces tritici (strain R3-111a-1) TaxID=644352 RepID=J3PK78_GAET3|nr:hypothetical protein GGTG_13928 [Gaeumannomyces tritici R3-111a-1]EJT68498.1 hypothetical protein GGTG_13928 [Gaeumannomyces tritici R3-111a-1]